MLLLLHELLLLLLLLLLPLLWRLLLLLLLLLRPVVLVLVLLLVLLLLPRLLLLLVRRRGATCVRDGRSLGSARTCVVGVRVARFSVSGVATGRDSRRVATRRSGCGITIANGSRRCGIRVMAVAVAGAVTGSGAVLPVAVAGGLSVVALRGLGGDLGRGVVGAGRGRILRHSGNIGGCGCV